MGDGRRMTTQPCISPHLHPNPPSSFPCTSHWAVEGLSFIKLHGAGERRVLIMCTAKADFPWWISEHINWLISENIYRYWRNWLLVGHDRWAPDTGGQLGKSPRLPKALIWFSNLPLLNVSSRFYKKTTREGERENVRCSSCYVLCVLWCWVVSTAQEEQSTRRGCWGRTDLLPPDFPW